ncbi:MAG: indole-3-glycerol phosphate synthase TrpC [Deltaproteobacteria bacterium]|nr:indole-3-glycerol phosphate synthase TrpC [Deltaproteobacteria bacterium]
MQILQKIVMAKEEQIEQSKKKLSLEKLRSSVESLPPCQDWREAITRKEVPLRVIAEIKRASPSRGDIVRDAIAEEIAQDYARNGAVALSVLTDAPFFHGSLLDLVEVKRSVQIPVLRKDFILDPYQVYESRIFRADAILLIMAILKDDQAKKLLDLSTSLGMATLVEVHSEEELDRAVGVGATILGINNRDLMTFTIKLETTLRLLPKIPKGRVVVSESGFYTREELLEFQKMGVDAFLVGEALMASGNPGKKLAELLEREYVG